MFPSVKKERDMEKDRERQTDFRKNILNIFIEK